MFKERYKPIDKIIICIFFIINLLSSNTSKAEGLLESLELDYNVSGPQIFHLQRSGYISGGSVVIRGKRAKNIQLLNITPPRFNIDPCSLSVDLSLGGISYISANDLIESLKSVPKIAALYFAKQFIQNQCPQCHSTIEKIQDLALMANNLTLDQCALAKSLADPFLDKINATKKIDNAKVSQSEGEKGFFLSWFGSKDSNKKSDKIQSLPENYNLVWYILSKKKLQYSRSEKEFIISLIGTMIANKENYDFKKGLLNTGFLKKLLVPDLYNKEKKLQLYKCQDQVNNALGCLKLSMTDVQNDKTSNFIKELPKILRKLSTYIVKGKKLSENVDADITSLINTTSIPIVQLIVMEYQLKPNMDSHIYLTQDFLELLAIEIIIKHLNFILEEIYDSEKDLGLDPNDVRLKKFNKEIKAKLDMLHKYENLVRNKPKYMFWIQEYIKNHKYKMQELLLQEMK